jgi:hypothetical protein
MDAGCGAGLIGTMKSIHHDIPVPSRSATEHGLKLAVVLGIGLVLAACEHQPSGPSAGNLTGVYTLATVDGHQVPARVFHDGITIEVRSGTFTFDADGSCHTQTVFAPAGRAEATRKVSGTYTQAGSKLKMRWTGAGTTTGTLQGNTFTLHNEGMALAYTK